MKSELNSVPQPLVTLWGNTKAQIRTRVLVRCSVQFLLRGLGSGLGVKSKRGEHKYYSKAQFPVFKCVTVPVGI